MSGGLLTGADEEVARFVFARIGAPPRGPYRAIGIVKDGRLVGGVVYSSLQLTTEGRANSCEMSVALDEPGACTRGVIRAMFRYPFEVLGCKYVWGGVKRKNRKARRFDERLGFKCKCIIEDGDPAGGDMALYVMRKRDCKWLSPTLSGLRRGERARPKQGRGVRKES